MIRRFLLRSALVTAILIACLAPALAQDAAQVLRLSVGYGTMKNTPSVMAKLTPETRVEVNKLEQMARAANGEGKYGDALKHLYHAMALMRGAEWTPARALGTALTVKLDRQMVEPGESVSVKVAQLFALDEKPAGKLDVSVTLLKMKGDDVVKSLKAMDSIDPDFVTHPLSAELTIPEVETGNYRVAVQLKIPSVDPVIRYATIHIERGLAADFSAAKTRLATIGTAIKKKHQDALVAALPSSAYRISLFDLARAGEINFERIDFRDALKEANSMLDSIAGGTDPLAARRGEFKKAYLSAVDNTLQPYQMFVPSSYDKSKSFPLIIALHGMGGDENSFLSVYGQGAFKSEAEKHGYIVACPKGRKPASMYIGDAEKDVMDVLAEVQRAYNVDPNRIYLTGHSMGGFGTWSVAMNHPDVFAAIAPISGGANNPASMSKIANIPMLVVHGDNDPTVPVERSRLMVAMGKKLGAEIKYIEVPGGDHGSVVAPNFPAVFEWFDSHKRKGGSAAAAAGTGSKN